MYKEEQDVFEEMRKIGEYDMEFLYTTTACRQ